MNVKNIEFDKIEYTGLTKLMDNENIIGPEAKQLLQKCFEHGGYVAGGFARQLLYWQTVYDVDRDSISSKNTNDIPAERYSLVMIADYLGSSNKLSSMGTRLPPKMTRGDIDLFFPTQRALGSFYASGVLNGLYKTGQVTQMPSHAGTQVVCDDRTVFQIINAYVMPVEQQLASFDLQNAMCAVTDSWAIVAKGWRELEETRTLHVCNWSSPYVINRISKWFRRVHNFNNLSQATASEIGNQAFKIIERLKRDPIKMPWGDLTYDNVVQKLQQFLPQCNDSDLLLLTAVYPQDAYKFKTPMKLLVNRLEDRTGALQTK